jgi:hypothetical protein
VQNFSRWQSDLLKVEERRKFRFGALKLVQTTVTVALVPGSSGANQNAALKEMKDLVFVKLPGGICEFLFKQASSISRQDRCGAH